MKQLLIGLSLALGVFFITPTPVAHAWSWSSFFSWASGSGDDGAKKWNYEGSRDGRGSSVPELDPSAAGSAIVLLLGGVAYVLSRRRTDEDVA